MKTLPEVDSTVYVLWKGAEVMPFRVLYVTQRQYIGLGVDETPHVPVDRQFILGEHPGLDYQLIRVPHLYATEREARLVLVANLSRAMQDAAREFEQAYRTMIRVEEKETENVDHS